MRRGAFTGDSVVQSSTGRPAASLLHRHSRNVGVATADEAPVTVAPAIREFAEAAAARAAIAAGQGQRRCLSGQEPLAFKGFG